MTAGVGRLDIVVYDCAEPRALAGFSGALLDREVLDADDSRVTLSAEVGRSGTMGECHRRPAGSASRTG